MARVTHCPSLLFAIFGLLLKASVAYAQVEDDLRSRLNPPDSAHVQILGLKDGSTIYGRVVVAGADSLTFQSSGGATIQLPISAVKSVKEVATTEVHDGEYWFENPNGTRLFFAPTGQMLKAGEGYVSDYEVFFPGVAYGVTDNITLGGGMSIFPIGLSYQVFYLTPKIGFSLNEKTHLATGALLVGSQGETGGIYYGVATFGDGNASFTVGGGYGFAGGDIESRPVGMVGGEVRLSRRIGFVTENYLLPVSHDNVLYSFGLRFMGEKMTTDLALFNIAGSGSSFGVPFVDFVFRF